MQLVTRDLVLRAEPLDDGLSRRYLALIADIAARLLAAGDPAAMVDELFELIRAELRLDVFVNYRYEPDRLVLETHGGLTAAEAEALAELAIGQAVCGCVARDRVPMHVTDVQLSEDPMTVFVRGMGVDAYACTPLTHGADLIGTLSFGRRWANRFTEEELNFLHTVCHYVALAKQRLRTEAMLREHVATQERLLSELNHRVRNALQLAVSMTLIEAGAGEDETTRAALARAVDRLQVLAAAHRPLYSTARADAVDLQTLLLDVTEQAAGRPVLVEADGAYPVAIDRAVALSLLVHELMQQSAPALAPRVRLSSGAADGGNQMLRIEFEGAMRVVQHTTAPRDRIVHALCRQLRASIAPGEAGGLILHLATTA